MRWGNRPVVSLLLAGALAPGLGGGSSSQAPPVDAEPILVLGAPERYLVRYEDTVVNASDRSVEDVRVEMLLPLESPRQRLLWVRMSPHAWRFREDQHGQRVATAAVDALAPGRAERFGWVACVELREAVWTVPVGGERPSASRAESRYAGDARVLCVQDERVAKVADEVRQAAGGGSAHETAAAAWAWVKRHVVYAREAGWDPAPEVLERGSGSCSEATFAFMAVTRRLGVPSRWVGGTLLRAGPPGRRVDAVFHRFAEYWDPRAGWVPADPTPPSERSRTGGGFGRLPRGTLVLARGDGSGDAGTGALYHSRASWSQPSDANGRRLARSFKRAYWTAGPADDWVRLGAAHGLRDGFAPAFPRAELMLADAEGFGPPLGPNLEALAPALSAAARALDAAGWVRLAERLFQAAHPGALNAALEAHTRGACEEAQALVEAYCEPVLSEPLLQAMAGREADCSAWLRHHDERIGPAERSGLTVTPTDR